MEEVKSETLTTLSADVSRALEHTKRLVTEVLANENVETQDPFNEFMAVSDSKGKKQKQKGNSDDNEDMEDDEGDAEEDDDAETELLPSYQILLSLLSLLTKTEASVGRGLTSTAKVLKDMSLFVKEVSSCETRQVIKQKALTQALFQLYHSAVIRTATTAQALDEDFVLKDCLFDYTELIVDLFDGPYEELI